MTLEDEIKKNRFSRFQILCGEESFLINGYRKILEGKIIPKEDELNRLVLSGKEATADALAEFGMMPPFMGEARLISIRESEWFNQSGEKKELRKIIDSLPPTTYVIFSERKVNKKFAFYKHMSKHRDTLITELDKKDLRKAEDVREIITWIIQYATHHRTKISDRVARMLLERIGNDMYALSRELDKLIGYVGDRHVIRESDIEEIAGGVLEVNVYKMVDAVGRGDANNALGLYRDLINNREDIGRIMYLLGMQFNQMYLLREYEGRGMSSVDMAKKSGAPEWKIPNLLRMSRRFDLNRLKKMVSYWAELDESVKTTGTDRMVAAELFLIQALTNP
ncbi:MAG: DNA polymerase III subunit delta [Eubacterium sp.]|nr:DNA polymerase III subunit delta [Eubacterium sp.]